MKIIGISGTNGSGKDTAGHILADQFGYLFISVTDLLREEARRRGLSPDRAALRTISAEWRREQGLGVLVDKALELFKTRTDNYSGLAVASLRNPGEADRVHQLGGQVIWLEANPKMRYRRIQAGAEQRDRAEEDRRTYKQFLSDEAAEMHAAGDVATLDMSSVRAKSDRLIINNGSVQALTGQLKSLVGA